MNLEGEKEREIVELRVILLFFSLLRFFFLIFIFQLWRTSHESLLPAI